MCAYFCVEGQQGCSLKIFKFTIKFGHSAQDVLPLPIPVGHEKHAGDFYALATTETHQQWITLIIKLMLFLQ